MADHKEAKDAYLRLKKSVDWKRYEWLEKLHFEEQADKRKKESAAWRARHESSIPRSYSQPSSFFSTPQVPQKSEARKQYERDLKAYQEKVEEYNRVVYLARGAYAGPHSPYQVQLGAGAAQDRVRYLKFEVDMLEISLKHGAVAIEGEERSSYRNY